MTKLAKLLLFSVCLVCLNAAADTSFWVDSDYAGTENGTQAEPWRAVDSSKWPAINDALSGGHVTIHFSARNAGADTEQWHSASGSSSVADLVEVFRRTDNSAHVLTFDGRSYFNQDDSTPSWTTYSGLKRCRVQAFVGQQDSIKRNNIRIVGFHAAAPGDIKTISVNGDNWVIEDVEAEHISFVPGGGPCVLVPPTADAAHEGSSAYASRLTNILFTNITVHTTQGEAIYLGGGGSSPGESGSGYPSHDGITIQRFTIYNVAFWGGQGDGIDGKGGLEHLKIRDGEIYNWGMRESDPARAITLQGLYNITGDTRELIGLNIHDGPYTDDAAIAIVNSWGVPPTTLIANALIRNVSRNGGQNAIRVYSGPNTVTIANDTIYNCDGPAIQAESDTFVVVKNSALIGNNSGGAQLSLSGAAGSDYNAFSGASSGFPFEGFHSYAATAAMFRNVGLNDFRLATGAAAIDAGTTVSGYSTDLLGATRDNPWDIGCYEWRSTQTSGATGVTVQKKNHRRRR